eukprot:TRINITY_DN39776_c0_g1_i1.p1 TRINITY_DN39776_c0_g1~~TRINITY_DN39776_c0_g1_i1.p1  ORF type:complete len:811 (+),score=154.89 TRINITY_DN39776_c0_g1_i1:52-2484(+)
MALRASDRSRLSARGPAPQQCAEPQQAAALVAQLRTQIDSAERTLRAAFSASGPVKAGETKAVSGRVRPLMDALQQSESVASDVSSKLVAQLPAHGHRALFRTRARAQFLLGLAELWQGSSSRARPFLSRSVGLLQRCAAAAAASGQHRDGSSASQTEEEHILRAFSVCALSVSILGTDGSAGGATAARQAQQCLQRLPFDTPAHKLLTLVCLLVSAKGLRPARPNRAVELSYEAVLICGEDELAEWAESTQLLANPRENIQRAELFVTLVQMLLRAFTLSSTVPEAERQSRGFSNKRLAPAKPTVPAAAAREAVDCLGGDSDVDDDGDYCDDDDSLDEEERCAAAAEVSRRIAEWERKRTSRAAGTAPAPPSRPPSSVFDKQPSHGRGQGGSDVLSVMLWKHSGSTFECCAQKIADRYDCEVAKCGKANLASRESVESVLVRQDVILAEKAAAEKLIGEWRRVQQRRVSVRGSRSVILNYFRGSKELTLKTRMARMLRGSNVTGVPLTFVLTPRSNADERDHFVDAWRADRERGRGRNLWILKSSHGSKGDGIRITPDWRAALAHIDSQVEPYSWVIQRYVERPMLIDGRKFDIRVWVLLDSSQRIYVYREGVMRTSSAQYNSNDLSDALAHLTNHAVQERGPMYGAFEKGNEMWYRDFDEYLQKSTGGRRTFAQDIEPQLKECIARTLTAARPYLHAPTPPMRCFQLFGFDFMVDESYRVWLLEVNGSPMIADDLRNRMVADLLSLAVFPHFDRAPSEAQLRGNGFEQVRVPSESWKHTAQTRESVSEVSRRRASESASRRRSDPLFP